MALTRMHQQRVAAGELERVRQPGCDDAEHFLHAEWSAGALQQRRHLGRHPGRHTLFALPQPRHQARREFAEMHRRLDHVGGAGSERIGGVIRIGGREEQYQRHRSADPRLCLGKTTLEAGAIGQQRHERERRGAFIVEPHDIGSLEHHESGTRECTLEADRTCGGVAGEQHARTHRLGRN